MLNETWQRHQCQGAAFSSFPMLPSTFLTLRIWKLQRLLQAGFFTFQNLTRCFFFFFPLAVIWEHYWKVASVNKSASVLKALRGFELQRLLLKTQIYKNVNHKLLVRNDNNSVKGRRCVSALPSELDQRPKSTHLTCSDMQPVRLCGAYKGYVSLTLFSCNSQGFL